MRTIAILSTLALAACADISPDLPGGESGDGPDFGDDPDQGGNPGGGGGGDTGGDPDEQVGSPDGGLPADPGDPDAAPEAMPTVTLDSFADGTADGWTVYGGSASVAGGAYRLANADAYGKSAWYEPTDDLVIEADIRVASGDGDAGVFFRATEIDDGIDGLNGYYAALNDNGDQVILGSMDGTWTHLASGGMTIDEDTWYHFKVVVSGENIRVYAGDMNTPKIDFDDDQWSTGAVGVRAFYTDASFDNVKITE